MNQIRTISICTVYCLSQMRMCLNRGIDRFSSFLGTNCSMVLYWSPHIHSLSELMICFHMSCTSTHSGLICAARPVSDIRAMQDFICLKQQLVCLDSGRPLMPPAGRRQTHERSPTLPWVIQLMTPTILSGRCRPLLWSRPTLRWENTAIMRSVCWIRLCYG